MKGEPVAAPLADPARVLAGGAAGGGVGLEGVADEGALALAGHEADVLADDLPLDWQERIESLYRVSPAGL